jgi:hypothetical protein
MGRVEAGTVAELARELGHRREAGRHVQRIGGVDARLQGLQLLLGLGRAGVLGLGLRAYSRGRPAEATGHHRGQAGDQVLAPPRHPVQPGVERRRGDRRRHSAGRPSSRAALPVSKRAAARLGLDGRDLVPLRQQRRHARHRWSQLTQSMGFDALGQFAAHQAMQHAHRGLQVVGAAPDGVGAGMEQAAVAAAKAVKRAASTSTRAWPRTRPLHSSAPRGTSMQWSFCWPAHCCRRCQNSRPTRVWKVWKPLRRGQGAVRHGPGHRPGLRCRARFSIIGAA